MKARGKTNLKQIKTRRAENNIMQAVYAYNSSLAMGLQVQWAQESIRLRRTTFFKDSGSPSKLQHRSCHPYLMRSQVYALKVIS